MIKLLAFIGAFLLGLNVLKNNVGNNINNALELMLETVGKGCVNDVRKLVVPYTKCEMYVNIAFVVWVMELCSVGLKYIVVKYFQNPRCDLWFCLQNTATLMLILLTTIFFILSIMVWRTPYQNLFSLKWDLSNNEQLNGSVTNDK